MLTPIKICRLIALIAMVLFGTRPLFAQEGEGGEWRIVKASGEGWVTTSGAQTASLSGEDVLKPGDSIRTGRNGRVLLARGKETVLVSPNSVVGLPAKLDEGTTKILQQSGSVVLEVEKRDARTFEVETPYLVAAVKGTQFQVSVNTSGAFVQVLKGSVEVRALKTGQYAMVSPGQTARVPAQGEGGLSLSGGDSIGVIRHGEPRSSSVQFVPVPLNGLGAPSGLAAGEEVRALGSPTKLGAMTRDAKSTPTQTGAAGALRTAAKLGEEKAKIPGVSDDLAHGPLGSPLPEHANDARSDGAASEVDAGAGANGAASGDTGGGAVRAGGNGGGGRGSAGGFGRMGVYGSAGAYGNAGRNSAGGLFGFAFSSADRHIPVWSPPTWTRYIAMLLVWIAFVALASRRAPVSRIRGWLRHPLLVAVMSWALAHLLVNGDLGGMIVFGSIFAWTAYDRIILTKRGDSGAERLGSFTRGDVIAVGMGTAVYALVIMIHPWLFGVAVLQD